MAMPGRDTDTDWSGEFAVLYDTHRGRLVRWLSGIFGPRHAEDIAQEALTRLYVRPGMLDPGADAWPWLAVVARNVGRDVVRHESYATPVGDDVLDQLTSDAGVHEAVAARDDAERLARALKTITPRDRMLLQLREVERVPVRDIAEKLRMADNAVRQQLFRARRRLADAYLAQGGERRGGILALLQVKAKETTRRFGPLADALGPSAATMLSVAGPVLAVVGGTLPFGGSAARDAAAAVRPVAAVTRAGGAAPVAGIADPELPFGATLPRSLARRVEEALTPPLPPLLTWEPEVGPVRLSVRHDSNSSQHGERSVGAEADVPGYGTVSQDVRDEWHSSGAGSGPTDRLCRGSCMPTAHGLRPDSR